LIIVLEHPVSLTSAVFVLGVTGLLRQEITPQRNVTRPFAKLPYGIKQWEMVSFAGLEFVLIPPAAGIRITTAAT